PGAHHDRARARLVDATRRPGVRPAAGECRRPPGVAPAAGSRVARGASLGRVTAAPSTALGAAGLERPGHGLDEDCRRGGWSPARRPAKAVLPPRHLGAPPGAD